MVDSGIAAKHRDLRGKVVAQRNFVNEDGVAEEERSGLVAPGTDVLSTVRRSYGTYSGTSMSSPQVAALAGLLAAQGETRDGIRSRILSTAKNLWAPNTAPVA